MRRLAACLLLLVLPVFVRAADDAAMEPALLVRLKSIQGLIDDAKYVAKLVGQANSAEQLEPLAGAWAGDKGLAGTGIDLKRPIYLYALATSGGVDSPFALMIPISDEAAFLKQLDTMHVKLEKDKDGIYTVDLPNSPAPLFFRMANNCLYVTAMDRGHLDSKKLVAPDKLATSNPNQLLGVTLSMDRIPDDVKQMALGQIEMRLADIKNRKNDNETPEQARSRRQGLDVLAVVVKTVLSEGKSLDFHWNIDQAKDDVSMSFTADAKPGTMMATSIKMLGNGKTRFAPASDSSLHVGLNLAIPDEIRMLINPFLEMGMKDQVATEKDPQKKAMAGKAIEALWPTLKAGVIDLHLAVGSPNSGGNYNLLTAIGVQGGDKIESTVRELIGKLPETDRAQIKVDATKVGGVSLHQLKIANLDPEAKRLFGDNASAWAGIGKTAMMLGLGGDASAAFAALTSSEVSKPAPTIVIEGSLSKLASLDKDPVSNTIAAQVFGSTPGTDRFRLSLDGGQQLKLSASFKGRGLTFLQQLNEKKNGQ